MNWTLLQNSLLVAAIATVAALLLGGLVALCLMSLAPRWRRAGVGLSIAALAMPPFLVVNCWLQYLGHAGEWRSWLPFDIFSLGGAVWILTLLTWPVSTLLLLGAWRQLDAAQLEADPLVSGWALIRALLWPLGRGAVAQSAALTFVLALNNFAVPSILQVKVFPAEVWVEFNTNFNFAEAWKLSWPLIVAPMLVLLFLVSRSINWPRWSGELSAHEFRRQLGPGWCALAGFGSVFLWALSVALPAWQLATTPRTWTELPGAVEAGVPALNHSLWLAVVTATLGVGLYLVVTAGQRRSDQGLIGRHPKLRRLFSAVTAMIVWLPFLVPGMLLGILFIKLFDRPGLAWFYQSSGIVITAFLLRYAGVAWLGTSHAAKSVDRDLLDAARLDGAGRWQLLRHVMGPLALPQLAAVWYLVFLICLWDVETIVMIMPPGGETVSLRVFNLLHYGHNAQVNALCMALLGVALAPLAVWWIADSVRRKLKSGYRMFGFMLVVLAGTSLAGCSPAAPPNSAPLDSKLFERAVVIGTRGVGFGQFNKPRSLTVDHHDNLYVVDMTGRVQKFSPDGKFLAFWQMPEIAKGKPKGMGCDRDGDIIVDEPHYSRVNVFSPSGQLLAQWGTHGTNAGQFDMPRSVAFSSKGDYFISEYGLNERIQEFAVTKPPPGSHQVVRTEKLLRIIGKPGTGPGELNRAEGLAIDAQDRLYVADSCNHRIEVFDAHGKFLRTYGQAGSGIGELSYPYDICVDAQGRQYVCEFGNSRIQVFDAHDRPIEIIGGPGGAPGQFANPWSLALDSHGNLYVADALNHRVQKLIRRQSVTKANSPIERNVWSERAARNWSSGVLECWNHPAAAPLLHHSTTPLLLSASIAPSFHRSIEPFLSDLPPTLDLSARTP